MKLKTIALVAGVISQSTTKYILRKRDQIIPVQETTTVTTNVEGEVVQGPFNAPGANYQVNGPNIAQVTPPCPDEVLLPGGVAPVVTKPYLDNGPGIDTAPIPIPAGNGPIPGAPVYDSATLPYTGPEVAPIAAPILPPPAPYPEVAPIAAPILPPPAPYAAIPPPPPEVAPIAAPIPPPVPYVAPEVAPIAAPIPPPAPYVAPQMLPELAPGPKPYEAAPYVAPHAEMLPELAPGPVPYDAAPIGGPIIDQAPIGVPGEGYPLGTPCADEGILATGLPNLAPGLYGADSGIAPMAIESGLPLENIYNSASSAKLSGIFILILGLI